MTQSYKMSGVPASSHTPAYGGAWSPPDGVVGVEMKRDTVCTRTTHTHITVLAVHSTVTDS